MSQSNKKANVGVLYLLKSVMDNKVKTLKKAVDASKDQGYVLYTMTQEQLANTLFPLGALTKQEVRSIADQHGFVTAHKHDSQDICFVPDGNYAEFIRQYTGKAYQPGEFIDRDGNVLGTHRGIIHYTIGQRRGLSIATGRRQYVCAVDPKQNRVILGQDKDLYTKALIARDINGLQLFKWNGIHYRRLRSRRG